MQYAKIYAFCKWAITIVMNAFFLAVLISISQQQLHAQPSNHAPDLAPIPARLGYVDIPLQIALQAIDPDEDDRLTFGAFGSLPPGATIVEQGNGRALFQWTPTRVGEFAFSFTVSDDGLPAKSDNEATTIIVKERSKADLAVQVTKSPVQTTVGDRVDHGIEVRNLSDEPVENVVLTITHAATVDYIGANDATCKEAKDATDKEIIICTINELNPFNEDNDTYPLTMTTQVNVPIMEEYAVNVWSFSNTDPVPANNQATDRVDVSEVTQDRIQLEISGSQSPTMTVSLSPININVTTGYWDDITFVTNTVVITTDRNGNLQLDLPALDVARIDLNILLTATDIVTVPIIDFDLSLNNMPPTGVFTTTLLGEGLGDERSATCTGIQLWTTDGSSQMADCASSTGHHWSDITNASHATLRGRLITAPVDDFPAIATAGSASAEEPLQLTMSIVNLSAPNPQSKTLYLPLVQR